MKKKYSLLIVISLLTGISCSLHAQNRFWVSLLGGNWNDPANWSATSGGLGGATVPGAGNTAVFDLLGLGNCNLDISPTVAGLTVNGYIGVIDLLGNNLTTTGANTFTTGTIDNSGAAASLVLNSTVTTTFSGTQFDADITGTSARILFNGSVFNGTVTVTKSDNNTDTGAGGNTFNGSLSVTNLGTGGVRFGDTNPDIFSDVTLNISNTGNFVLARTAALNQFNGNITINYNSTGDVLFGSNGGTSTLADTYTLSVNCGGTGCDDLSLANFTQVGTTPQSITLAGSGDAALTLGPNSTFNAPLTFTAEQLIFNTSTFNEVCTFTQTGATGIDSPGGNTFQQAVVFNNLGAGSLHLGTNGANPGDIWNADATFNNSGGARIRIGTSTANNVFFGNLTYNDNSVTNVDNRIQISRLAGGSTTIHGTATFNNNGNGGDIHISYDAGTSTTFNGDIIVNQNTTSPGQVWFGNNGDVVINGNVDITNTSGDSFEFVNDAGAGTVTFGNGTITVNTFNSGTLRFENFQQTGVTAQTISLGGTASLILGPSSQFAGDVNFDAPQLLLNGCTFDGAATLEKTGATNNNGNGGNTFNGVTSITLSGSGYLLTGNTSPDIFNGPTTLTNTGTDIFYLAHNSVGTQFNNSLSFNSTSTSGIRFCQGGATATATLTNASMSIGGLGFSAGPLILEQFTQTGALSPQSLTLTGSATLTLGSSSSFEGEVDFDAPRVFLDGATFNNTTSIDKTGASGDTGAGNNIFFGTTTLTNSGSGDFRTNGNNTFNGTTTFVNSGSQDMLFEFISGSTYNGDVTFNNTGSSYIRVAYLGATAFNGNIVVNNPSGIGVYFCESATATATLADMRTITIGGGGFSAGQLRLSRFTQVGATTPQALTLAGTGLLFLGPSSSFDGEVTFIAPQLFLNGTTYNNTAYLEKTSVTSNSGTGGNVFFGETTLVNSGDAFLLTGSTSPDIFNDRLIIINSGASTIRLADNSAGNQFNGNIELNSTSGGGIYFGNNVNGTSTLAATRTIGVGGLGVISGDVRLLRFTQVGDTDQFLGLSGIAVLTLGPSSSFGGDVDFSAPQLLLNGTTFERTADLEKDGASDNIGTGGNLFQGITTITNSGSGYLRTANTLPDIFDSDLTVTNTGSNIIYLAYNTAGNEFNGDITFNSTIGSVGVYICNQATASATLAAGGSLLTGGLGFSSGRLQLRQFQQLGNEDQTLVLTGTGLLELGPATTFNGNVDFESPQFELDGATFNGPLFTILEKTGATNNDSNGGNDFNGPTTIANSGSGWFRFAVTGLDTFDGDLELINTGSGTIRMADNVPGTVFNGNILVNSTAGGGIYFSESGGGTATLSAGRTIQVGGTGFSIGDLRLRRFTQSGPSPLQNLVLTGTSILLLGPGLTFESDVDFSSPQVFLQGGTYQATATIEKTGATNNVGTGGNTFVGDATLINSGTGYFMTGNTTPDVFGNLLVSNTGTSSIRLADNSVGNQFTGDITFHCTSGIGIWIGNTGGSSTLSIGQTFNISTFNVGELRLQRITQLGNTVQNMTLTGTALLRIVSAATFEGDVNFESPQVFLNGGIFEASSTIEKTGAGTNDNAGGNTFNGTTVLTNSSTARWRLAFTNPDAYNGPVTFIKSSSGVFEPSYNQTDVFTSDVTTNGNSTITFNNGTGISLFTGTNPQTISKTGGSTSPIFRRLTIDKAADAVTLATDMTVSVTATFVSGVINSDAVNFLNFANDATAVGAIDASYVDGAVRKTGDDSFTFPVGDNGFYRPVSISAPTATTHFFTAQYFNSDHGLGSPAVWDPSFYTVTACEYWTVDRNSGASSDVFVTLSWNELACNPGYITLPADVRVTRWDGANWVDHGNGGTTGTATNGTIITSAAVTSFSPITLASVSAANPLPVELAWFRASITASNAVKLEWHTASELNNESFDIQRSKDGFDYQSIGSVQGAGTTTVENDYVFIDEQPLSGRSYYRLKQNDFDGSFEYSYIITVELDGTDGPFTVHPNPAGKEWVTFNRKVNAVVLNNLNQVVGTYPEATGFNTSALSAGVYIVRTHRGEVFRLLIK